MNAFTRMTIFLFMLLAVGLSPLLAQNDCPDIVEQALAAVEDGCADTGNNQVCYGNVQLEATARPGVSEFTFDRTGDLANLVDLQSLVLSGMDEAAGTWGVALMRVRANIPDTLPGQNVTFLLFGDVVVENATAEQAILLPVQRLDADVNVRSRPEPEARQIAALVRGQTLYADGRLADNSWLRVQNPVDNEGNLIASVGWVSTPFVSLEGDINSLPVLDPSDTTIISGYGPMQAFYFRSGVGDSPCAEAPDSGILVQTPEGIEQVNLRVNGMDVQLGSTAYFQADPGDEMILSTIEGSASVQAQGETQIVAAGTRVTVDLDDEGRVDSPPSEPEPYDLDALGALPVDVLPRAIEIAAPLDESQIVTLSGDLQLTLTWDNDADMDLSIVEPDGNTIWYANRNSPSGAALDVDAIPCANNLPSVENISWPEGTDIPAGTYVAGVNQFSTCSGGSAAWTLTILVGGEVVLTEQGIGGERSITFNYDPATGIDLASVEVSDQRPQPFGGFGGGGTFGNGNTLDIYDNPNQTGTISIGETVSGQFPDGSYDVWTFDGSAGETISITMTGDFDTYLELYGPDGAQVSFNDDYTSTRISLIPGVVLPADGVYTIVARGFSSRGGNYELTLDEGLVTPEVPTFEPFPTPIPPSSVEQGSIESGQTVNAELSTGERHAWTFEGRRGETVTISMDADNDGFDTYLELYGPDGTLLTSNDDGGSGLNSLIEDFTLPESGTYTIVARSFADFGSGGYELTLDIR
ncbi:MAG: pre-peptidase C-terminal domain-containing protein [Chloroflexi bacterium]|nr:pre-peptidase C-terminal domain-containing protein [Chloroflexota bacterium]